MAIGWTLQEIGQACGHNNRSWANELLKSTRVHEHTAARITAAYEAMSMTIPEGKYRNRARALAAEKGYLPPLTWDDPDTDPEPNAPTGDGVDHIVIARIMSGEWRMKANPAERIEVITRWIELGYSQNEIGRRTGWNVDRDLKLHGHRDAA
jgi:hypothetical protein